MLEGLLIGAAVLVVVALVALVALVANGLVRLRRLQAASDRALVEVSQELGLWHRSTSDGAKSSGEFGGRKVTLRFESVVLERLMLIEIELDDDILDVLGGGLMLERHGAGSVSGTPTPIGDPEFDGAVDLRGAQPTLLRALQQQPGLRQLVMQCVEGGARLISGKLQLSCIAPTSPAGIRNYLDPALDLARRIRDPDGAHTAPPAGTPMSAAIRAIDFSHPWWAPYVPILDEIGKSIGQGQAYGRPNDATAEWRGTYQGVPLRVGLDSKVQAKVENPHGDISLSWDPSKVEQQAPRDAWRADEPVYLFVGKAVFFYGKQADVDLEAARLRSLGVDAGAIARAMTGDRISSLRVQGDTVEAKLPSINQMLDPEGQIVRTAQLVGGLARTLQSTAPDPGIAHAAASDWHTAQLAPLQKYTCHYCNTLFLMTADSYECPNCGAPVQG